MRHPRLASAWIVAVALLVSASGLASCGGDHLKSYRVDSQPLVIASTDIREPSTPQDLNTSYESADRIVWEVPITGGSGSGPYVLSIIDGALPSGVTVLDDLAPANDPDFAAGTVLHHFRGTILASGTFSFRLQVVDKGTEPFLTTFADFTWTVGQGAVQIVDAKVAGVSVLYPQGTLKDKVDSNVILNPDHAALASVVFNKFVSIELIVAGGTGGPYACQVVDDVLVPDDGTLPTGTILAPGSSSIVGSPSRVTPPGSPNAYWLFTVEASDRTGQNKGRLTIQWTVDTPAIVIATPTFLPGKCGSPYSDTVVIVDGVPPFKFELVKSDVARLPTGEPNVTYQPSVGDPIITPVGAKTKITYSPGVDYPLETDTAGGTFDYAAAGFTCPPEGVALGDVATPPAGFPSLGSLAGTSPRRKGTFRVIVHVYSSLAGEHKGQHNWKVYPLTFADSEPPVGATPAFGQDPAYTKTGAFSATQPYATIAEVEASPNPLTNVYNPDATFHSADGLLFRARGGVREDGRTDGPHTSDLAPDPTEDAGVPGGGYTWAPMNWNPVGDGDPYSAPISGLTFTPDTGVLALNGAALVRQWIQALEVTVSDEQLPLSAQHTDTRRVNVSVGPDRVVITESTASDTNLYYGYWTMNDVSQRVRMCDPYENASPVIRDVTENDLSATTTIPATTGLSGSTAAGRLLSARANVENGSVDPARLMDIARLTVNPTGWWDDNYGLSAAGPRQQQHADVQKGYSYYGEGYGPSGNYNGSYTWAPNATCVEIQDCTSSFVSHDPLAGKYKDGGQLYLFHSQEYFGLFMVRRDGTIYVPTAFSKATYQGFGDQWLISAGSNQPWGTMPSITISPDGRLAAMKLKLSATSMFDGAASTKIVLFTLTGEKLFYDSATSSYLTYKVIGTGSNGSYNDGGVYQPSESLVLTNRHLYYLCVNSTTQYEVQWNQHYLYRYEVVSAAGLEPAVPPTAGSLLPAAVPDANWPLSAGVPLQTPYHWFQTPSTGAEIWGQETMNLLPGSMARLPFRVSQNGRAIAIIAASTPSGATSFPYTGFHQDVLSTHVWVDYDGAGVRRASSAKRRYAAASARGYGLTAGSNSYPLAGRYNGPTPGLEISDDGLLVAAVANRHPVSSSSYYYGYNYYYSYREDVVVFKSSSNWAGATTEVQVTGNDGGTSLVFSNAAFWRFGCLAFTRDNKGLVFWGGCSSYYPNYSYQYYQENLLQTGTFYACDVSAASGGATGTTGVQVYSILSTNDGGNNSTSGSVAGPYTASSQYNPSGLGTGSTLTATAGVISPLGGFRSSNGNFMYITNMGALNTTDTANYRLVGVNLTSSNATLTTPGSGKNHFRAFALGNWPVQRGFDFNGSGVYAMYEYTGTYYGYYYRHYYGPVNKGHDNLKVVARKGGQVFFAMHWQQAATSYPYFYYGGPVYNSGYADYGSYLGHVYSFNADIGGNVQKVSGQGVSWPDTGTYTYRPIQFVMPSADGSKCAFVLNGYSSTIHHREQEQLYLLNDTRMQTNGSLVTASPPMFVVQASSRISTSISFSPAGDAIYYASGTGNENNKTLYKRSLTASGTSLPTPLTLGSGRRYEVLHVGR